METLGQKLTAAREKKKLTISRAAALTRIKVQHLEMMENDDFSTMPAPTYAKGFIRIYAELLGLDPEPLVREYIEKHLDPKAQSVVAQNRGKKVRAERKPDASSREDAPDWIKEIKSVLKDAAAKVQKAAPKMPLVIMSVVGVLVLVGIVRCSVRSTGGGDEAPVQQSRLDGDAIMKEPATQYFELPTTEDQ